MSQQDKQKQQKNLLKVCSAHDIVAVSTLSGDTKRDGNLNRDKAQPGVVR